MHNENSDQMPGEAESPKTPGGPSQSPPASSDSSPPVRNMADIARLFLDGARPARTPPKRTPPAAGASPEREVSAYDSGEDSVEDGGEESPVEMGIPVAQPEVAAAVADTLPAFQLALAPADEHYYELLASAANALAARYDVPVGLVAVHAGDVIFDLFNTDGEIPPVAITGGGGAGEARLARVLKFFHKQARHWIIAIPATMPAGFRKNRADDSSLAEPVQLLRETVTDILLVSGIDKNSVIGAYQSLKSVCVPQSLLPRKMRAFMVADDLTEAVAVHHRLRSAAQNFLHAELSHAGSASRMENAEPLFTLPLDGQPSALWESVLDLVHGVRQAESSQSHSIDIDSALIHLTSAVDELIVSSDDASAISAATFDQLASVLDPEERSALNAAFDIREFVTPEGEMTAEIPVAAVIAPPEQKVSVEGTDTANVNLETLPSRGLRPIDSPMPHTPDSQWQVISRSACDFLESATLLETSSPLDPHSLLALDGLGHLHLFTLASDATTWPALWQWARDHRHLLALTQRETPFDPLAPVHLHLVLPLCTPRSPLVLHPPMPHLHLYRLHCLAQQKSSALLLVPVG